MMEAYVIHLPTSTERMPLIVNLERQTGLIIQIFLASDGQATWNDANSPKRHPWRFSQLTQGMVGCAESHFGILEQAMICTEPFFVFEDDTVMSAPFEEVQEFVRSVEHEWDIILLGANEYVESEQFTGSYSKVGRFWGTHAMLVNPRCCAKIMETFEEAKEAGIFLPADWMYNEAIRLKGLRVYGPLSPKQFFFQMAGLKSLITGNLR